MQEKARSLCEWLEGQVDPFDLDVFNPHIQSHVKRAVQRLQVVYALASLIKVFAQMGYFSVFPVCIWSFVDLGSSCSFMGCQVSESSFK